MRLLRGKTIFYCATSCTRVSLIAAAAELLAARSPRTLALQETIR
ncbi:MAG: hypothetical protein SVX43_04980 [Cyanobacteriota bacterium]|nr:hypothetical protein [Cyanobacteriota bacterium]